MIIQRDKKLLILAIAAILLITAGIVIGFINTPKAHFTMDINPSIQITTNQLNRVTKIEALNDDAKDLLSYYTKPQKNLEAVINDLLDLMVFTGYIHGGSDNLVMITVSDDSVDKAILDRVNQAISDYLAIKQISASIVNQTLEAPETTNAQRLQLTGREAVVEKIILEDRAKTRDELMSMSLNELIAYAGANQIAPDKLISVLMASESTTAATTETVTALSTTDFTTSASESNPRYDTSTFITLDRAKAIALSEVSGTIIKAELDDEDYYDDDSDDDQDDDDFPKYEIEIRKDNKLYEIKIHAITGKVIEVDLDDDEDSDDDDDIDDADDDDEDDSRNTTNSTVASTTTAPTTSATTSTQTDITRMTASEARQAVLNRFGGIIQKIEYAYDDTNPHYKGEALKDGSKVVFELNARTKNFTKWDTENDNSWEDFEDALPNMITLTQTANLAVAISEQSNTFVQKIDFNWDDSEPLYQGEAFNKGVKYSFEIYAYGGTFKKWDISRGDDTWEEKYYNVK